VLSNTNFPLFGRGGFGGLNGFIKFGYFFSLGFGFFPEEITSGINDISLEVSIKGFPLKELIKIYYFFSGMLNRKPNKNYMEIF
jgi:hypothetical protein